MAGTSCGNGGPSRGINAPPRKPTKEFFGLSPLFTAKPITARFTAKPMRRNADAVVANANLNFAVKILLSSPRPKHDGFHYEIARG
jgi:hypothetical protein